MKMDKENVMNRQLLTEYSLKLFDALSNGSGLQTLVDIGFDMLGNPFSIHDMSFKVIAFTGSSPVNDDPVWNEVIADHVSADSWSYYVSNKLYEIIAKNESPFFWTDQYCKYPRIVGKIMIGSKQIAGLTVCAHLKPFTETDLELTALICKGVSVELQKNKYIDYSRGLLHEDFLRDLLDEKLKNSTDIHDRINTLSLSFQKYLFVLSVDVSRVDIARFSLTYLRNELESKIPNCKAVVYEDKIVLLLSRNSEKQLLKNEMPQIVGLLKASNLFGGISRSFQTIEDLREYYFQSIEALKLGIHLNQDSTLFKFENYAIYHLADICRRTESLDRVCHPSLLKLIEYDKYHGTDFTGCLYVFIIHSKNISESASVLNIHRNTMFFRIEKLELIMNIDLNDTDTFLHLHFSFKILELLKVEIPRLPRKMIRKDIKQELS